MESHNFKNLDWRRASTSQYTESEVDSNNQDWDDWEGEEEQEEMKCLFCPSTFGSASDVFRHCQDAHNFDFVKTRHQHALDFYQCIRLINYIRKEVMNNQELGNSLPLTITGSEKFLTEDEYLAPVLESDGLLYAFEDLDLDDNNEDEFDAPAAKEDIKVTTELERDLLQRLRQAESHVEALHTQFAEYQNMVRKTFLDEDVTKQIMEEDGLAVRSSPALPDHKDDGNYYFNSYAQNDIHEQMLKDRVRTEGYRNFIYDNKDVFKDKIVLDIGCGTGILSMFAARAGAKTVISVDNSAIIEKAKANVKENGLDGVITLLQGRIEEITLPVPQVDIIISEWMGYFLLFEAMLDSVLVARDRWLAPGGILAPSQTRILIAGLDDENVKNDRHCFWDDVYGFKMSAMKESIVNEAIVDFVSKEHIITDAVCVKDLPLQTISIPQLDFVSKFKLTASKQGTIYALVGWFDTWFTRDGHDVPLDQEGGKPGVDTFFTTGPHDEDTHWKQTIFVLDNPISVVQGTVIEGIFTCHKGIDNPRELDCEVQYSVDGSPDLLVQSFHLQ
ncbi:S-adenosyl-L-methionine-dependent methyltransferase [Umbelopsis sp. AD052]|nr:S-adenosyl-L-methionine-dependent methyltransferase [Umbelopsis sp. AD052]